MPMTMETTTEMIGRTADPSRSRRRRQRENFHRTQVLPPTEMTFPNSPLTRHSMRVHPLCSWRQWFSFPFPLTGAGMRASICEMNGQIQLKVFFEEKGTKVSTGEVKITGTLC